MPTILGEFEQLLLLAVMRLGDEAYGVTIRQAIEKARTFGFDLKGSVMASDAFFPFPDCVEIAHQHGIDVVIQPGGSVKDEASIRYCDDHNMAMVFTGIRHFKH